MLYSCTHMAIVGVKWLLCRVAVAAGKHKHNFKIIGLNKPVDA